MIVPISFLRDLNGALAHKKHVFSTPTTDFLLQILQALVDVRLLRPVKPRQKSCTERQLTGLTTMRIPMRKGFTLLGGLKALTTPGRFLFMTFKNLKVELDTGSYYIISNDKGVYSTLSPKFRREKKGGVLLFKVFINKNK